MTFRFGITPLTQSTMYRVHGASAAHLLEKGMRKTDEGAISTIRRVSADELAVARNGCAKQESEACLEWTHRQNARVPLLGVLSCQQSLEANFFAEIFVGQGKRFRSYSTQHFQFRTLEQPCKALGHPLDLKQLTGQSSVGSCD